MKRRAEQGNLSVALFIHLLLFFLFFRHIVAELKCIERRGRAGGLEGARASRGLC